jgi:hypothetical protein
MINQAKDGLAVMSVERKLNLSSIKSVAMSTYRDDWIVSTRTSTSRPGIDSKLKGSQSWAD